jgi:hypothetical protein
LHRGAALTDAYLPPAFSLAIPRLRSLYGVLDAPYSSSRRWLAAYL